MERKRAELSPAEFREWAVIRELARSRVWTDPGQHVEPEGAGRAVPAGPRTGSWQDRTAAELAGGLGIRGDDYSRQGDRREPAGSPAVLLSKTSS